MGWIIDLAIILIIALSTFLAYRKGLISLAVKLCIFIIAIVVTLVLYKPVSNLVINVTAIDESIENSIMAKANDIIEEDKENDDITNKVVENVKNEMLPETARGLAINIVNIGVMLLLYITIRIALRFVKALTELIAKLPIIKQVDKIGGSIYGAFRGILLVYVILLILSIIVNSNPKNEMYKEVEKSFLGKVMYENNILSTFIK